VFHNTTPDLQDQDQDHSVQDQDQDQSMQDQDQDRFFGLRPVLSQDRRSQSTSLEQTQRKARVHDIFAVFCSLVIINISCRIVTQDCAAPCPIVISGSPEVRQADICVFLDVTEPRTAESPLSPVRLLHVLSYIQYDINVSLSNLLRSEITWSGATVICDYATTMMVLMLMMTNIQNIAKLVLLFS